jgi:hypothetical protein
MGCLAAMNEVELFGGLAVLAVVIVFLSKAFGDLPQETDPEKRQDRLWNRAGTVGLCAAAAVGLAAIVVSNIDASHQREVMRSQLNSMILNERAYVFVKTLEIGPVGDGVSIAPQWGNSGTTPTKDMLNWVSWKKFKGTIPADYGFPDLGDDGKPMTSPVKGTPLFVGPGATIYGQGFYIPRSMVEEVARGDSQYFVWGWAEYNDVFEGTRRHRTKFCNEVKFDQTGLDPGGKPVFSIWFPICSRGNCTDDECKN